MTNTVRLLHPPGQVHYHWPSGPLSFSNCRLQRTPRGQHRNQQWQAYIAPLPSPTSPLTECPLTQKWLLTYLTRLFRCVCSTLGFTRLLAVGWLSTVAVQSILMFALHAHPHSPPACVTMHFSGLPPCSALVCWLSSISGVVLSHNHSIGPSPPPVWQGLALSVKLSESDSHSSCLTGIRKNNQNT